MATEEVQKTQPIEESERKEEKEKLVKTPNKKTLKLKRKFTDGTTHPFDNVEWIVSRIVIKNTDKKTIFDYEVEHPIFWDEIAVRICADKYFKTKDVDKLPAGGERSIRDVIHRVALGISMRGFKMQYIDEEGKDILYDEICYIIIHQLGAFASPIFFNWGLYDTYGFKGNSKAPRWAIKDRDGEVYQQEFEYESPQGAACFITEVDDELVNGETGIYDWYMTEMSIFANGSGSGLNVSRIRGENEPITGGGVSSGLISFLEPADTSAGIIKSGGKTRRAAKMLVLDDTHPDFENFIKWKAEEEFKARALILAGYKQNWAHAQGAYKSVQAQNANNSVRLSDAFMNAVKDDEDWSLKYVTMDKIKETKPANKYFDLIASAAWECGDPGILFKDTINKWNTIPNTGEIRSSNPCVVGNTLIATADGRNAVSIKQLAKEGKDVQVYCMDNKQKTVIRWMRNPRLTGKNKKILKIIFDDGSFIKCTENHKFNLRNNYQKEAKNLSTGDSICSMTKFQAKIPEVLTFLRETKGQDYWWINDGGNKSKTEHRLVIEFHDGKKVKKGKVVHHKNCNGLDNRIENLEVMCKEKHYTLHGINMLGCKNPMRDRWWNNASDEEKSRYRKNMSEATAGTKNGRYINVSNEDIFKHALGLVFELQRSFIITEWQEYAAKNNLPVGFSKFRKNEIGNVTDLSRKAAKQLNLPAIPQDAKKAVFFPKNVENYYNALKSEYKNVEIESETYYPIVTKECECCGSDFKMRWSDRERAFCSVGCSQATAWEKNKERYILAMKERHKKRKENVKEQQINIFNDLKLNLERIPQKKEWVAKCKENNISAEIARQSSPFRKYKDLQEAASLYNHRVISVEFDGYEDVYNGTVDEFHNMYSVVKEERDSKNRPILKCVNSRQCGEYLAPDGSSCNLASLNLVKFFNIEKKEFEFENFEHTIEIFIISMEIICGGSSYPSKRIAERSKDTRPLGLGYCNMGGLIMCMGFPYDSDQARSIISTITSLESAIAYRMSAKIASIVGPFNDFDKNRKEMLSVIKMHQDANNNLRPRYKFVKQIHQSATQMWEEALNLGTRHGFRNSQVVVIAPTGCLTGSSLILSSEGLLPISEFGNTSGEK